MARPALRWLVRLALPALLLARPRSAQAELFGRWQQPLRQCELEQRGATPMPCHALQIDQRNAEVLRLVLQADSPERGELIQLTLVGALADGSQPLSCRSSSCSLRQPLQLRLISASLARFDVRGLAQTLPRTWPVRGRCSIDPSELRCEASAEFSPRLDDAEHQISLDERVNSTAPQWSVEAKMR